MSVRECLSALCFAAMIPLTLGAAEQQIELKFEIATLPGFQRHVGLLEHPGYIGIALENNDLHPTPSGKMLVRDRGTEVEVGNGIIRFAGKNGTTYAYEAGLLLGIGKASVTFPVTIDLSALASGRTIVVAKLPLANLISDEKRARIHAKVRTLANVAAQQKVLNYLDGLAEGAGVKDSAAVREAILVDAFNRSGAPGMMGRDVGDAVPLSEQWMLLVTLAVWLVLFPAVLLVYRLRRRRARPAVP